MRASGPPPAGDQAPRLPSVMGLPNIVGGAGASFGVGAVSNVLLAAAAPLAASPAVRAPTLQPQTRTFGRPEYWRSTADHCSVIGGFGRLDGCRDVVEDQRTGHYIISDYHRHRLEVYEPNGAYVRSIGGPRHKNSAEPQFESPWGIVMAPRDSRVVVCDYGNQRLQTIDVDSGRAHGQVQFTDACPLWLAIGCDDTLFVTLDSGCIAICLDDGTVSSIACGQQATRLLGIAINSRGHLIVCDEHRQLASVLDRRCAQLLDFGSFGRFGACVAVDRFDRVLVSDCDLGRVHLFDADFGSLGGFGSAGTRLAQLSFPQGVHVDQFDRVAVCDGLNARVQVFAAPTGSATGE